MLIPIITYLIQMVQAQQLFILFLLQMLLNIKAHSRRSILTPPEQLDYQKLTVNELPTIKEIQTFDYKLLLQKAEASGKPIKPIRRRKESTKPEANLTCPSCQAPSNYLYEITLGDAVNTVVKSVKTTSIKRIALIRTFNLSVHTVTML